MTRRLISSGSEFETRIGYSRAVVDGDYVFLSGTTGYNYKDMSIGSTINEQTEQCFLNIADVLNEAGCAIGDIVRITYILQNRDLFESCWPVLNKWLGKVRPAATMFEARLINDDILIEIEITARIPK